MRFSRLFILALCIVFSLSLFCGCSGREPVFTLSKTDVQLQSGQTEILNVKIENIGNSPYDITWESDNTDIATVNKGIVKAVSEGQTSIKAHASTTVNKKIYTETLVCSVSVTGEATVESLSFSQAEYEILPGAEMTLVPDIYPIGASADLVWTSMDTTVATVDENGKVTAIKEGTTTIIVTANGSSVYGTCEVAVTKDAETKTSTLTLNRTSISLYVYESFYLSVTDGPIADGITWQSSNTSVATIDQGGKVTAWGEGTVILTALSGNNTASCVLTVTTRQQQTTTANQEQTTSQQQTTTENQEHSSQQQTEQQPSSSEGGQEE